MLVKQSYFYARWIRLGGPDKYAYGLKSQSYEVVLLDETGDVNVNKWIVLNHYGEWDSDTKHFIDFEVDRNALKHLHSDSDSDSEESDCSENNNGAMVGDIECIGEDDAYDFQFDVEDIKKFVRKRISNLSDGFLCVKKVLFSVPINPSSSSNPEYY